MTSKESGAYAEPEGAPEYSRIALRNWRTPSGTQKRAHSSCADGRRANSVHPSRSGGAHLGLAATNGPRPDGARLLVAAQDLGDAAVRDL
ncbi:hypothetical protein NDU88_006834 [Pleurodeles waltl]|uniref:Uncharacterized protein n=1 Tax=Pleurodeles waltl TaxID=8319 RepID=A0AAV7UP88_PLEWA|nr:hypothetical protein NDU88_006834 [Pleurodeles waltl]